MKLPVRYILRLSFSLLALSLINASAQSREPQLFPFKQNATVLLKVAGGYNLDNDESFEIIGIAAQVDNEGRIMPRSTYLVHLEESPSGDLNLLWRYNLPAGVRGDFCDLKVADLNQDGSPELVVLANFNEADQSDVPWLYIFNYEDEFASTPTASLMGAIPGGARPRPTALDIGDLNADGWQEILISTSGAQRGLLLVGLQSEHIADGVRILAYDFDLKASKGVQPFVGRLARVEGQGLSVAVLGGSPEVSLEIYPAALKGPAFSSYLFKGLRRDDFDIGNFTAGDLDGDGWDEFLIPLKSGGAYLAWWQDGVLQAQRLLPTTHKIASLVLEDLNANQLVDILSLSGKDSQLRRTEFAIGGELASLEGYTSQVYSAPLLEGIQFLGCALVRNSQDINTGAVILPFYQPGSARHGLVYWWLEENAPLSTLPEIDSLLSSVDSTLARVDSTRIQQDTVPPVAQPMAELSEREELLKKFEGVLGVETPLAPIPESYSRQAIPAAAAKLQMPDVLVHPGETVQRAITIPGLSLENTRNLSVQVETPPGMRFDLPTLTFYWVPADTQLGWHKIVATLSWLGNKEVRSFTVYVNQKPRIISQLPPRDVIQIGETFNFVVKVEDENQDAVISYKLLDAPGGATINTRGEIVWKPSFDQVDWYDFLIEVSDGYDTDKLSFALFVNHPVSIETTAPARTAIGQQYSYTPRIVDNNKGFFITDYTLSPRITDWKQTGIVEIRILEDAIRNNIGRYIERYRKSFPLSPDPSSKALFQDIFEDSGKVVFVYNTAVAQSMDLTQIVNTFFKNLNMTPPTYTTPARRYLYKFSLKEAPQGLQMAGDGTIVWTPTSKQYDFQSFSYTVTDGFFLAEEHAQVYVNFPPKIISRPDTSAFVNTLWQYEVKVSDLNTDSQIRYELLKAPEGMVISPQGVITWRPTDLQLNNQSFTLRVTDGMAQDVQRGRLFVNAKPRILSVPKPVAMADIKYEYQLEAEDPNNEPLTYRAVRLPKNANFDAATGLLTWTPRKNQKGVNEVVIEVRDPHGWNVLQEFQVHVFHNPSSGRLNFLRDTISLLALIGVIYLVVK